MSNFEIEQEISQLLNSEGKWIRKKVESDTEYILAKQQGDWCGAKDRVLKIIFGSAENMRELRKLVKKKRKLEKSYAFI